MTTLINSQDTKIEELTKTSSFTTMNPPHPQKDGGDDDDDDDDDGPSLLSRTTTSKAAQSQGAKNSSEGRAAESSPSKEEQQLPENTQTLNPSTSTSPNSDQQPIANILSKPSTSIPEASSSTLNPKEP